MRRCFALTLVLAWLSVAGGCGDAEAAPTAPSTAAAPRAPGAAPADDPDEIDEESHDLGEDSEDEAPLPLGEMDQPALEEACFRGRQGACDLLGH